MTDERFHTAMKALKKGDKAALGLIYEEYIRLIYSVVYDILGRREDAEDVTSEFFIKLVRVSGDFKQGSSHKAWMVRIARNMAIDYLRKNSREMLTYDSEENAENGRPAGAEPADSASVENKTTVSLDMGRAMKKLKREEKEIIDMKLLGGLTFKEIAGIKDRPIGTVTWLYNQGIKKLRRCLSEYGQDR